MRQPEALLPPVQVLAANMSFFSNSYPYAAYWSAKSWEEQLGFMGYEGLEYHALRLGAQATKLATQGIVGSVHQSWRGSESKRFVDRLVPEAAASLTSLASLGRYSLVAYPEKTPEAVELAVQNGRFATVSAQMYPGLMRHAGARNARELARWMQDNGLSVCWASFHARREEGDLKLGDYRDVIPPLAATGMLDEMHVEIGRGDARNLPGVSKELLEVTRAEASAFMRSPEAAAETETGKMIALAVASRPPGSKPLRMVVETHQATLIEQLDRPVLPSMRTQVTVAHANISRNIQAIAHEAQAT